LNNHPKSPGRPALEKKGETKLIGFKAGQKTRERLKKATKKLGINQSEIIRSSLLGWLDSYEKTIQKSPKK